MVRRPEIKLSPTIFSDFWVLVKLGPQKRAKKAILERVDRFFRCRPPPRRRTHYPTLISLACHHPSPNGPWGALFAPLEVPKPSRPTHSAPNMLLTTILASRNAGYNRPTMMCKICIIWHLCWSYILHLACQAKCG